MIAIVLIVLSYLIGSFPTAYVLARLVRGIDIRRYGTGNVGGSNVGVQLGAWATVVVGLSDIAKGALPPLAVHSLGGDDLTAALCGLAVIIGHNWSLFLGFKGGRGMATILGSLLVLAPWGTALVLASILIGRLMRLTAFVNAIGVLLLPLVAVLLHQSSVIVLLCLAIVVVTAVKRLLANGEPYPATIPPGRVRLNRLLFDRDVSPSAAWGGRGERRQ